MRASRGVAGRARGWHAVPSFAAKYPRVAAAVGGGDGQGGQGGSNSSSSNRSSSKNNNGKQQTPKKQRKKEDENPYSKTVNLPVTSFDMRANSVVKEPQIQEFWAKNGIYEHLAVERDGEAYVLHDGPPYANGDLHIGHALNKILKDFINRYQIMRGKKVRFVPGWDCHGMPIELKVLQTMKGEEKKQMTPLSLRKKAAQFATETVAAQRESFKRYGVWADWDEPYLTLSPEY